MHVGLLECDHVADRFRAIDGDYRDMFARWLGVAIPGLRLETFDVCNGHLPAAADACDAYVCGGSRWQIISSAQLSEAMPALVAAVTLNLVSMIEYSAIAGTIGAGGIGYLAVVYGYQRFDNHIMIATIVALIATIQLIQFLGDRLVNRLRHTQGNLV